MKKIVLFQPAKLLCRATCVIAGLSAMLVAGCSQQQATADIDVTQPPAVPERREVKADPALADRARAIVKSAAESDDPLRRANAVEAAAIDPQLHDLILHLLDDPDSRVRFAAAMSVGRLRIGGETVNQRLEAMAEGSSPNGRVAAIFALYRLGDTSRSARLGDYARSPDPVVRANTAIALGLTGEPTAVRILETMLTDADGNVRLNAAEALWRLGDERGLSALLAASMNQYSDDNVIGTLGLSAHFDLQAVAALRGKLTDDYPEVALAAARGLGQLGLDAGYGVAAREITATTPRRRSLAALAFGDIGRLDAQPALEPLLADADHDVRLAAATAVLQLIADDSQIQSAVSQ